MAGNQPFDVALPPSRASFVFSRPNFSRGPRVSQKFECGLTRTRVSRLRGFSRMSSSHLAIVGGIAAAEEEEEEFLRFVDSARRTLAEEFRPTGVEDSEADSFGPSWGWVFSRILKTCVAYSSGVTPAILLSDLFLVRLIRDRLF